MTMGAGKGGKKGKDKQWDPAPYHPPAEDEGPGGPGERVGRRGKPKAKAKPKARSKATPKTKAKAKAAA